MTARRRPRRGTGRRPARLAARPWFPYALIVAAGALAHLWCLGSIFFLDDVIGIRDCVALRDGRWWAAGGHFKQWTYLGYHVQMQMWGLAPAGFHAVNWVLHVAVACVLHASGREYFEGRKAGGAIALGGALVFVAHPLGSEVPNYARCQDLAWVTLFSLLAAWFTLRLLKTGDWRWLAAVVPAMAGATFSKGPGFFHAAMMVGIVALGFLTRDHWRLLRARWRMVAAATLVLLAVLWFSGVPQYFYHRGTGRLGDWPYGWHAVTMCRVFWEFIRRFLVPTDLSADHFIAASQAWDAGAVAAVAGVAVWTLGATVLLVAGRRRALGVCLWLTVGAILLRFLYYINEFMPEYRIYPGLPWLALGAVAVVAEGWARFTRIPPAAPFGVLVAVLCLLSAARSFQWHRLESLTGDILRQYPMQGRALWMLQRRDAEREDWDAIIRRHPRFAAITREFLAANKRLAPTRALSDGHHLFSEIACRGYYAEALAASGQQAAALSEMARLRQFLARLQVTEEKFPTHWSLYHHALGRVYEKCGRLEEARAALETSGSPGPRELDLRRVLRKLGDRR